MIPCHLFWNSQQMARNRPPFSSWGWVNSVSGFLKCWMSFAFSTNVFCFTIYAILEISSFNLLYYYLLPFNHSSQITDRRSGLRNTIRILFLSYFSYSEWPFETSISFGISTDWIFISWICKWQIRNSKRRAFYRSFFLGMYKLIIVNIFWD